ncbi:hypothetical protein MCP_2057 [Methanocella paludicola SANAE]|uniref:Uncharacterized protein n=1 Tax=Methanocella paludicola (strain DSM 17711 / JCM 13418 / NBRC 101707 / SANAE) TaxID=304371 RepID=D1Z0A7_METPS|nr:hypothetical protein MCP_2057 [Methanocella paludicola SANAE]
MQNIFSSTYSIIANCLLYNRKVYHKIEKLFLSWQYITTGKGYIANKFDNKTKIEKYFDMWQVDIRGHAGFLRGQEPAKNNSPATYRN